MSVVSKPKPDDYYTSPCPKGVVCDWCCHAFPGTPKGIPMRTRLLAPRAEPTREALGGACTVVEDARLPREVSVIAVVPRKVGSPDATRGGYAYCLTGTFCIWECARAKNRDIGGSRGGERDMIIVLLASGQLRLSGGAPPPPLLKGARLGFSPPRECLRMFGGTQTIEEFRADALVHCEFLWEANPLLHLVPNSGQLIRQVVERPYQPARRARAQKRKKGKRPQPDDAAGRRRRAPPADGAGARGVVRQGVGRDDVAIARREQPMRSSGGLLSSLGMMPPSTTRGEGEGGGGT